MSSATTIPRGRPEPISLDFDRLRAEGIRHLENLATELWTDFNAGNPGITILEVLCYAITDLAYRTRVTPIADLAAGDGKRKMFFLPEEILTSAPVTPNDFRKILIDLPGVKNAWLEVADTYKLPHGAVLCHAGQDARIPRYPSSLQEECAKIKAMSEGDTKKNAIAEFVGKILSVYRGAKNKGGGFVEQVFNYIANGTNPSPSSDAFNKAIEYLKCQYGVVDLTYEKPTPVGFQSFHPQGLYRVILDLDEDISSTDDTVREATRKAAWETLHANRNLCHDYLSVAILETEDIAICLDLQLEDGFDEKVVLAEAIYRLQDFLTPAVRFYSLAEMLEKRKPDGSRYRMDDIYNGPLLLNGFIDDAELDCRREKPSPVIRFSDLYNVLAPREPGNLPQIAGLKAVNSISIKWLGGNWVNWDNTSGDDKGSWRTENPRFKNSTNFEYRIRPELSQYQIQKGKRDAPYPLKYTVFKDEHERILLERNCKYCSPQNTASPPVEGRVRPDLAQYRSIQYDFPGVYHLGDNQLPLDAPAHKVGPMRQMQAYLLFFDQILAAYLARLGETAHLLAVEQDITRPSYMLPVLFEVPGMRLLLEARAAFVVTEQDLAMLMADLLPLMPDSQDSDEEETPAEHPVITILKSYTGKKTTMPVLRNALLDAGGAPFCQVIEHYFWQKYSEDQHSNFRTALAAIAESAFQRQNRRNTMLEHLLARFGDTFSTFVASLISADLNPEDTPGWFSFDDYLRDKAKYLLELPSLGYHQPKGYNYRKLVAPRPKMDAPGAGLPAAFEGVTTMMYNRPDVWSTTNVAGVKKRVCFLLGLTELKDGFDEDGRRHHLWETTSVFGETPYVLDIAQKTDRGRTRYFVALQRKMPPGSERRDRADALMTSALYSSRQQALELRKKLYEVLDELDNYTDAQDKESGDRRYIRFIDKKTGKELLASPSVEEGLINRVSEEIKRLVRPRITRDYDIFHLVEHILLRPNEPEDRLLEIPLNNVSPPDPYSNIVTIVAPDWTRRFGNNRFRLEFERTVVRELPAYVYPRFCYIDRDTMQRFEIALKDWMLALATCRPNECKINDTVKILIEILENEVFAVPECDAGSGPGEPPCD